MNNREKILTGVLICLLAVYASGILTGGGYLDKVRKLKDEYAGSSDAYDDIIRMAESLNEYEMKLKNVQIEADAIPYNALNAPDDVQLIETIYSYANLSNVDVIRLELSDVLEHDDSEDVPKCGVVFIEARVYVEGEYSDIAVFAKSVKAKTNVALAEAELSDDRSGGFSGSLTFKFYGTAVGLKDEAYAL